MSELPLPKEEVIKQYDRMLAQNTEAVNEIVKDIIAFKLGDVKGTKVSAIEDVLKYFNGTTLNKKKENLIEFLRLMPSFRTTDTSVLERRLSDLKYELRRKNYISDLLVYAQMINTKTDNEEEKDE